MGNETNWEKAADGLHDKQYNKGCVTLWPCHFQEKVSEGKRRIWKFKYFTMQKYNLQKNPLKETKIL